MTRTNREVYTFFLWDAVKKKHCWVSKLFGAHLFRSMTLTAQKLASQQLRASFKQKKTMAAPIVFNPFRPLTRNSNNQWWQTIISEYRSHFGSRYKLGCCDIASLFHYSFYFPTPRKSKPVHSIIVAARFNLRKSVSAWGSSAEGRMVLETQGAGVAARYLWHGRVK